VNPNAVAAHLTQAARVRTRRAIAASPATFARTGNHSGPAGQ